MIGTVVRVTEKYMTNINLYDEYKTITNSGL